jgi:hypothetical protein
LDTGWTCLPGAVKPCWCRAGNQTAFDFKG